MTAAVIDATTGSMAFPTTAAPHAPGFAAQPNYLGFIQGGYPYAVPDACLIAIVGIEHLRKLAPPVPGWAGTLATRGGMVPVLDAATLLGHAGGAGAVLLLRLPSGPLGLVVEHLEGLHALPHLRLDPAGGATGLLGSFVAAQAVVLALDPGHLDCLRQIAVAPTESGHRIPQPVAWLTPVTEGAPLTQHREKGPGGAGVLQPGQAVVVMAERAAADPRRNLAIPVQWVRAVRRRGSVRPNPPSSPGLVGFRAWGTRAVPVLDSHGLGLATTPAAENPYAIVLNSGVALLTAGVRGVQALDHVEVSAGGDASANPGAPPLVFGETRGRRRADQVAVGEGSTGSTETGDGALVAILDPAHLVRQPAAPASGEG